MRNPEKIQALKVVVSGGNECSFYTAYDDCPNNTASYFLVKERADITLTQDSEPRGTVVLGRGVPKLSHYNKVRTYRTLVLDLEIAVYKLN